MLFSKSRCLRNSIYKPQYITGLIQALSTAQPHEKYYKIGILLNLYVYISSARVWYLLENKP